MKKVLGALALVLVLVLGCAAIASADAGIDPNNIPEGKVVNWGDLCSITRIAGHDVAPFDQMMITIWPTCTEYGEVEFDCIEKSGEIDPATEKHYHILRIAPLGHDWASEAALDDQWGIVIKKPTCTEKGLAQDVCLRCGETREKYREIDKLPHEYYAIHEPYYKEPTCTETGLAQHECIWCGKVKPNEKEAEMAVIPKLPHNFTEWMQIEQPTCDEYGAAERMCVWCGMHQKLDGTAAHDILDEDGNHMRDYVWAVAKLNPNWSSAADGMEFKSRAAYNIWLALIEFEYDNSHKWLQDCYTRLVTFECPYCHGMSAAHDNFTIKQVAPFTISHIWSTTPDPDLSVAPTCLEDGKNVYLCIYDPVVHGHAGETFVDEFGTKVKDPQMKVEKVPALGHDWSDLKVSKSYWKDGQLWDLWVATCERCGATQEEAKLAPEGPKDPHGFILCDDGIWRLYDNGQVKDFTGFYEYDGAEFFLVNGELVDFNGMVNCPGDKWVFMSHGRKINVSKLVEYAGEWFFVEDGELDTSKNGIYWYDGARFVFSLGRLCKELNGLWQDPNDGTWWFIANGQVQDQYKGVALYDGEFFLLDWGQLDVWYEGTLWYDGAEFKVVEGQLYAM